MRFTKNPRQKGSSCKRLKLMGPSVSEDSKSRGRITFLKFLKNAPRGNASPRIVLLSGRKKGTLRSHGRFAEDNSFRTFGSGLGKREKKKTHREEKRVLVVSLRGEALPGKKGVF